MFLMINLNNSIMSFVHKLDSMIRDFCDLVSRTHHLNKDDVYRLWTSSSTGASSSKEAKPISPPSSPVSQVSQPVSDPDTEITREKIMAANKDMLNAMCKKRGLKVTGKKDELVQRLIDSLSAEKETKKTETKVTQSVASKNKNDSAIVKTIKERSAELAIRKNKFGNFEHMSTGLVFNTDKMVYGRQLEDGKVNDLTLDDIELCKKNKFMYKIPENLNTSKNLDDIKIEDIEEEVLDDEDIEEEEEEEEEDDIQEDEN